MSKRPHKDPIETAEAELAELDKKRAILQTIIAERDQLHIHDAIRRLNKETRSYDQSLARIWNVFDNAPGDAWSMAEASDLRAGSFFARVPVNNDTSLVFRWDKTKTEMDVAVFTLRGEMQVKCTYYQIKELEFGSDYIALRSAMDTMLSLIIHSRQRKIEDTKAYEKALAAACRALLKIAYFDPKF